MSKLHVALAGNPNSGKTTLFNGLTGARQKVGNWPGVTVEKKSGEYKDQEGSIRVVDLPGTYSLGVQAGSESLDEKVARNYLFAGDADVVINIIDASNLERNLYLTVQLLEMHIPTVIALNKTDITEKLGIEIDKDKLSSLLGCPVVAISAAKKQGIDALMSIVRKQSKRPATGLSGFYTSDLEDVLSILESQLPDTNTPLEKWQKRWLSLKILEGDTLQGLGLKENDLSTCFDTRNSFETEKGEEADLLVADCRFTYANQITHNVKIRETRQSSKISDILDRFVLHRIAGPVIFLGLIYLMFMFTINLGGAFIDFFDLAAQAIFVDGFGQLLTYIGLPQWMIILLADGIGGGFQVVATFIPIIGFLYLFLAVLEDSGYMARAAFMMDRFMRKIGLPGKSFVPLIVGFGCNVPAIMATRTLDQHRDRIMTVMMAPFMSCGARLAVYALFAAAFFPSGGQNVVFALYLVGIGAAIATGFFLKKTLLQGDTTPFVMELPSYNVPRPVDVFLNAWIRLKGFLFGAGKIIVIVVAVLTMMNSLGKDGSFGNEDSENSVLSEVGKWITPILSPLGIEERNWPAAVGVFTGIFAKEAVVGTLDALYSGLAEGDAGGTENTETVPDDIWSNLQNAAQTVPENLLAISDLLLDPLGLAIANVDEGTEGIVSELELSGGTLSAMASRFDGRVGAFAYLLFILLYTPCVAALGAVNRELGSKWTTFATFWTTGFAFALSIGFYQIARFDRSPITASFWLVGIAASITLVFFVMRRLGQNGDTSLSTSGAQSYAFATNIKHPQEYGEGITERSGGPSCH